MNRYYKIKTLFLIDNPIQGRMGMVKDARTIKKIIYQKGIRNQTYSVTETNPMTGTILNQWLYKYMESGIIFTKTIYSKRKEDKEKAKREQLRLFEKL
uniref:Uncharacterized protein n=1 Tax=Dulem virus 214 TaxID=3145691 RepID=A0AAU8B1V8_9VIRU